MSDSVSKILIEKCGVAFFLVVILALAIIAILHFGVKFDINEFIESCQKTAPKVSAELLPTYGFYPRSDNSFQVNPLFYTPFGTPNWFCSRCGAVLPYEPDQEELKAKATYYLNHPKAYKKTMRIYDKHAKKSL